MRKSIAIYHAEHYTYDLNEAIGMIDTLNDLLRGGLINASEVKKAYLSYELEQWVKRKENAMKHLMELTNGKDPA